MGHLDRKAAPGPSLAVPPSTLWKFLQPHLLEGGNTPREQTHHPLLASAPTENIPAVLPNKLIALPRGGLRDNRCQLSHHRSRFLDFILFLISLWNYF